MIGAHINAIADLEGRQDHVILIRSTGHCVLSVLHVLTEELVQFIEIYRIVPST